MKLHFIILVICFVAIYSVDVSDGAGVQVEYATGRNNDPHRCTCKGSELRIGNGLRRGLKLTCRQRILPFPELITTCQYEGNPHGCRKYNNNGQRTFYQQALNQVGAIICSQNRNRICPRGTIITQLCGDLGPDKNFKIVD